ncbi:uncharacterized protein LOC108670803 [Hyalella azteca]|uniref:Uncharacterized protein LOC108670803 n=1 Tax=Hyalella azteca TaxID=294128 RepID=A0A8B7NJG6_HYAAZ|nr:uncharacterized protein LOC108670803 [Hyalella azteca]
MASIIKECSLVLHELSNAAVRSGRCPEQSLTQASPGGSRVKSEALEKVDPPPFLEVPAIAIKEEPEDETEEVSIKEEPFFYGNEVCSTAYISPAPALSSFVPCKMEPQVESHNALPNSSQNITAPLSNQVGQHRHQQTLLAALASLGRPAPSNT